MKLGIIKEGKIPPDARTPLTPEHCKRIMEEFPVEIMVEPSQYRCFPDVRYAAAGVKLNKDLSECDIILGVKEIPIRLLLYGKTYFFFSHTIKKQVHNRQLLQAILAKNIRLIDYEVLKNEKGNRLIAFGRFAGMVGAHNALWVYGERTNAFHLPRMKAFEDYSDAVAYYKTVKFPPIRIVLTGTGRVSSGSYQVLKDMGIREVSPEDYLTCNHQEAVFTQLDCRHYVRKKSGEPFEKEEFYTHPEVFVSNFKPYCERSDLFINGIFWDTKAPRFFSLEDMRSPDFNIQVIADVTCDIAPDSSVPSTIRPSTIAEPVYGFDPFREREVAPFLPPAIDVMAIDNLPNEMPRDASRSFGEQFIHHILPELFKPYSRMLEMATIAEHGNLGKHFEYLRDYVEEPHLSH